MNERYILLTVLAVAYLDFQILWEAAQPEQIEDEPPVGASFLEARYLVDAVDNTPVVEAEWTAENFSGRWEWVAVAPASAALRLIDGATLAAGDDSLRMLLPVIGRHQSVVRFPAATSHDGALRFPVLPAASNLVVIAGTGRSGAMVVEGEIKFGRHILHYGHILHYAARLIAPIRVGSSRDFGSRKALHAQ